MRFALLLLLVPTSCVVDLDELTCAFAVDEGWAQVEFCYDDVGIPRTIEVHGDTGSGATAKTDLGESYALVRPGDGQVDIDWPPGRPESLTFGCCLIWARED